MKDLNVNCVEHWKFAPNFLILRQLQPWNNLKVKNWGQN
nr:MAG TPA: hypothetical protein [Caudoviricetes sp.]